MKCSTAQPIAYVQVRGLTIFVCRCFTWCIVSKTIRRIGSGSRAEKIPPIHSQYLGAPIQ